MNNIPDLLNSKRFWTLIASIIAMFVVALVPDFQSAEEQLVVLIAALGGLAIAGYSLEDALRVIYPSLGDFVKETPNEIDDNLYALATLFLRARYPDAIVSKPETQINVTQEAPQTTNEMASELVKALQQDTPPQEVNIGGAAHGS